MRVDILKRIFFAKKIFEEAKFFCMDKDDEIRFAQGILLLHDSTEIFLAAICSYLEISASLKDNASMPKYIELIHKNDEKNRLLNAQEMNRLNSARISIKHQGFLIKPEELGHLPEQVHELMVDACSYYCKLSFEEISLAVLIEKENFRIFAQKAEEEIKQQKYKNCFESLAELVYLAFEIDVLPGPSLLGMGMFKSVGAPDEEAPNYYIVNPYDNKIIIKLLEFEIDTYSYYEFKKLTPVTGRKKSDGKFIYFWEFFGGNPDLFTEENVKYCLNVAIDIALKVQYKKQKVHKISSIPDNYSHFVVSRGEVAEFYNLPQKYKQSYYWLPNEGEESRKMVYKLEKKQRLECLVNEQPPYLREYLVLFRDKIKGVDGKDYIFGFVDKEKIDISIQRRDS